VVFLRQTMSIKESKGLSLIEMMIVVLLIGIMATISSYAYSRYVNNTNLRSWARQLATDITAMKAKAVLRADRSYQISFNKTANTYTLNTYDISTPPNLLTSESRPLTTLFGYSTPGITINSLPGGGTTYTLTFLTRGLLSSSPNAIPSAVTNCDATTTYTCWIVFQNSRGSQATITFNIEGKTYVTFAMQ